MTRVVFVQPDGSRREIPLRSGLSIMEGAINNGIDGIDAECGGACSCATCRVDIDPAWQEIVGPPNETESEMLTLVPDRRPASRLSCQIKMRDALDGLIVHVPGSQA